MTLDRRSFIVSTSAAAAAALLWPRLGLGAAQAEPFTELRGGVGTFTGQGGTIGWYVSKAAVVVIDSQFPRTARVCLKGVQERASRPIDLLINTHHHRDHTGGNGVFKEHVGKIVAHAKVPALQKQQATEHGNEKDQTYADTTFQEEWKHDAGKERITCRHFGPAHTGGDAVVHFEGANVVHVGDLVFHHWHPFIDLPGGASVKGWVQVLDAVLKHYPDDAIYIFGHGTAITGKQEDLKQQRNYLTSVWETVARGLETGKSRDQITALEQLPGFENHKSHGERLSLAANLGTAYDEQKK